MWYGMKTASAEFSVRKNGTMAQQSLKPGLLVQPLLVNLPADSSSFEQRSWAQSGESLCEHKSFNWPTAETEQLAVLGRLASAVGCLPHSRYSSPLG
jgi:hypothetical protein